MAKNRSRRLRKKLHVDEFQELGFEVEIHWTAQAVAADMDVLFWRFIAEVIEGQGLCFGGSDSAGFIYRQGASVTEDDRAALARWLEASSDVASFTVGPLVDAWYPEND